ncbi:MAG: hypothetical protein A2Z17_04080 [Gammaproteobacteria bacterium RBG_16_66_13]|nr:MAG: hypothetical protein A2Z17_04080 [Gammaproteobacteria bacterium RBG_16_66_13]
MLRLKGCPRCGGDLYLHSDLDGPFWLCLQCGRATDAKLVGALTPALVPVASGTGPNFERGR